VPAVIELESLAAREEIKELRARYFRYVDGRDWQAFGQLFVSDATLDLSDDVGQVLRGRDEIVRFVAAGLKDAVSVHHGHMPEISLASATRASGIWAMEDRLFWPPQANAPLHRLHGFGHYHDVYVRDEGRWLFESVSLRRSRVVSD
jgi:hypothetical protein